MYTKPIWIQTALSTGRKPNVSWRRTSGRPWKEAPSECHLVTTGTSASTVATVQWRNGPQGLRDDDDDDNDDDDELDGWVSYIDITDLNF